MAFGRKAAAPPVESTPAAEPTESATEQLASLLNERSEIGAKLDEHREVRRRWLVDGGTGALDRIAALGADDDRLKLRAEQLEALVPAAQAAVRCEREAQREARWQSLMPELDAAMEAAADAVATYEATSGRYRELHSWASQQGFDPELRELFVTPPHPQHNPYVFHSFRIAVEQCHRHRATVQAMATAPVVEFDATGWFGGPAIERFVPKRVSRDELETISAIAEPRAVRILHGPVRTAQLNIGIARMHAGEQHIVNARAAHALVASGVAEYADEPATAAA